MTTRTQPIRLLKALIALGYWQIQLNRLLTFLSSFWRFCRTWPAHMAAKPPARFKPWLNPVSRSAMPSGAGHWRSKPDWVRLAVFDLALGLPGTGYRTIANCFNLQQMAQPLPATVSKTFVAKLLTSQRAALAQARMRSRSGRLARREPVLTTWGMDLTGMPLTDGSSVPVFGIIDHGSRAILALQPVASYNSLILLGRLLIAMGMYGKPQAVRSDNDAVFKTWIFKAILKLIGVRHQFTDLGSPWQNGRIERFWRTLKSELRTKVVRSRFNGHAIQTRMKFASVKAMQSLLEAFKLSYNAHRPHQSLQGKTPVMLWNGQVEAAKLKLKTKPTSAAQPRMCKARAPPA